MADLFKKTELYQSIQTSLRTCVAESQGWLRELRKSDLEFIEKSVWPTVRDEAWRYSNLSFLGRKSFTPVTRLEGVFPEKAKRLLVDDAINIVLINGIFCPDKSTLPPCSGVNILMAKEGIEALGLEKDYVLRTTRNDMPLFMALNRLAFQDSVVIEIQADAQVSQPIVITQIYIANGKNAAIFPRVFLRVKNGAKVDIVESHGVIGEEEVLVVPVLDLVVEENAQVEYVQHCSLGARSFFIGNTRIWQQRDSVVKSFLATAGSQMARHNMTSVLEGDGAEIHLNGLHFLKGENHADSHTCIEHTVPHTQSHQLYKTVLDDQSHSVFHGRVCVDQLAQQTNSYQLNKNLILSKDSRVDTKPQLDIHADDVKCSHGATIGQLNKDEIFYLQTRGINEEDARQMLLKAFMQDVLNHVSNETIRDRILK